MKYRIISLFLLLAALVVVYAINDGGDQPQGAAVVAPTDEKPKDFKIN